MATLYLDLIYRSQSEEGSKSTPVQGLAVRESRKFIISYKVKGWSSFEEVAQLLGAIDARIVMQSPCADPYSPDEYRAYVFVPDDLIGMKIDGKGDRIVAVAVDELRDEELAPGGDSPPWLM